jgi:hypothetical protein
MNIEKILNRLDNALGNNKKKNKVDFKEMNEARKKAFFKLEPGKNTLAFLVPKDAEDPFTFWGFHNGLQETPWFSTPCNLYNKQEDCLICSVVDDLKRENFEGNKHLWNPIRQQIEKYAPVINLKSEATIAEGPKWFKVSNTAFNQMIQWIRNLEKDEEAFFSHEEPQKVIITYTKDVEPAKQHVLDKKNMVAFSDQQIADWLGELKPVQDFFQPKSQDQIKRIVDEYFERIANEVSDNLAEKPETSDNTSTITITSEIPKESRLSSLKKGK